jgi:hypothetical protein
MLQLPTPLMLHLDDGQLLRWTQAVAVRLRVIAGRVWVTRPGDPDDHFLDAGDQLRLDARSRVLIGAEGEARVAIEVDRRAGPFARVAAWVSHGAWHSPPQSA